MNKYIIGGVVIFILIILAFVSFGTVPAGYVGVHTRFSAVTGSVKQPGFYAIVPFTDGVTPMDVQIQKDQADATAASNDLQQVTATIAVNYHVEPQDAGMIYQSIGVDYADRVIAPAIAESVKAVISKYTAEELITKRETVRDAIKDLLAQKLQTYGVQTDSLNIVNFAFSDQFNTAIEAKVTAQQNALAAQNKLAQVQFEAQQAVAQAQGNAKAIAIQAQAIEQAGGTAYLELQAIKQWDGHMPTYMGSGSSLLFNIPTTK